MEYNNYDITKIFDYMRKINNRAISDIVKCRGLSVSDYCAKIWVNDIIVKGEYAINARQHISKTLFFYAEKMYGENNSKEIVEEFNKMPVFQTGPHFQLALEKNNFFTALFSIIGIKKNGGKYYFNATCTTPSLETRKKYGPMWLNVYDSNYNIFDFSQLYRKRHKVYNAIVEKPYVFKPDLGVINVEKAEGYIQKLRSMLSDIKEKRMVQSLLVANKYIWKKILSEEITPIYLLEDFYVDLMINMLKDKNSMLYCFFSSYRKQYIVLTEINKYKNTEWSEMIPTSTDFFWKVSDRKFSTIHFKYSKFVEEDGKIFMDNKIDSIIYKLENKEIIPNIFIIILMQSILGQVRLAGGLHQLLYYNVFKESFLKCLDCTNKKEKDLIDLISSQELNHWGCHVLEPDIEVAEIIEQDGKTYDKLIRYYENYSFDEAIDDMKQFRIYHRWKKLLNNL